MANRFLTIMAIVFVSAGVAGCGGKSGSGPSAPANQAPVANAGVDQTVLVGAVVTLDGSASSDPDNNLLTYSWSITAVPDGSAITALSDATAVNPSFTPDLTGAYTFDLVVNDGTENSAADSVTVTAGIGNVTPVANAGIDRSAVTGRVTGLDGSGSSDANGDTLTYTWSITSVPATSAVTVLTNADTVSPSFTPDVDGAYVFSLVVSDGTQTSAADSVTITAAPNAAPVANAGMDGSVPKGVLATLDGSASSDANGDALTYAWSVTSVPAGSAVNALASATTADPSFTPDVTGAYVFALVVNDGYAVSAADSVIITATNTAPVANAGADQAVIPGTLVQLDGGSSSDANGDSLTYSWTLSGKPGGSSAALSNATAASPSFTADLAGTYTVELTVNDGLVDSSVDSVTITAMAGNVFSSADTFPMAIPDASVAGVTSTITVSGGPASITNIIVFLDITHPYNADIDVKLETPIGAFMDLTSDNGGAGDNYTDTYISDYATDSIRDGAAPFTGEFKPEQTLIYLNGQNANGDWKLHVYDDAAGDTGTLNNWKLVFLTNAPPRADAGPDQRVVFGNTAQLNGSGSSDADLDSLTYSWTIARKPAGSTATLSNSAAASPTFAPDVPGLYTLSLVVNDGSVDSTADTMTLATVAEFVSGSSFPLAIPDNNLSGVQSTVNIGSGPASLPGLVVPLDITHTYIGDLQIRLKSPAGTETILSSFRGDGGSGYTSTVFSDFASEDISVGAPPYTGDFRPDTPLAQFNAEDSNGAWTLTVIDDFATDTGTLNDWRLHVLDEVPPIANAGSDQVVQTGNPVQLDGSASFDGDGDGLTYRWYMTSDAPLSKALLSDASIVNPTFTPDQDGEYVFDLVVNDGTSDSLAKTVRINTTSASIYNAAGPFPIAIPDEDTVTGAQSTITVSGGPASLTSVRVYNVNITHSWVGDLVLKLESPTGTIIILTENVGSDGNNYTNTSFSDTGSTIGFALPPYTGTYKPSEPLSSFNGENADGIWKLHVYDTLAGDTGEITGWTLVLE